MRQPIVQVMSRGFRVSLINHSGTELKIRRRLKMKKHVIEWEGIDEIVETSYYIPDVLEDGHDIHDEFLQAKLHSDHPDSFKYLAGEINVAAALVCEEWHYEQYNPNDELDEPFLMGTELRDAIMSAVNVSADDADAAVSRILSEPGAGYDK